MNEWQVLGIEPTNDESAIKKAYAKQLKHNKPDKNPEGFKALREAYESALATRFYYIDDADDDIDDTDMAYHDDKDNSDEVSAPDAPCVVNEPDTTFDNPDNPAVIFHEPDPDTPFDDTSAPTTEELVSVWYDINDEGGDDKDGKLVEALRSQTQLLPALTLDERMSYEEELLDFFAYQDDIYPISYAWASDAFMWQSIVDTLQAQRYPWYHLGELQERYRFVIPFNTHEGFCEFLKAQYPTLYDYYHNLPQNLYLAKWYFAKKTYNPTKITALSDELQELNALLTQNSKLIKDPQHIVHHLLTHNHALATLHKLVFDGVFHLKEVLLVGVAVFGGFSVVFGLIDGHLSRAYALVLPIVLFVGAFLMYWQSRWHLYASPQRFLNENGVRWLSSPQLHWVYVIMCGVLFFGAYSRWAQHIDGAGHIRDVPDNPSYFIAQLLGLTLWHLLMRASRHAGVPYVDGYWGMTFVFVIISLFLPTAYILSGNQLNNLADIVAYSPLFWLILCLPAGLQAMVHHTHVFFELTTKFAMVIFTGFTMITCFLVLSHSALILPDYPPLGAVMLLALYLIVKSSPNVDK